jgi:hypothetical protein
VGSSIGNSHDKIHTKSRTPLVACAHGLIALVRGGALQTLTGLYNAEQAEKLPRLLANTFTQLATP